MKRLPIPYAMLACLVILLSVVVMALPGCTNFAGLAPAAAASAPAPSFNDKVAKAIQEVALARQAATQLAVAGKISKADDQAVQATLDVISAQLAKAQMTDLFDPAQGAQILADALAALAKYQGAAK